MKRRSATKQALFSSILALLLCVSMLVSSTFAWFTDEVKTGMNTIAAGNLDIALMSGDTEVTNETMLFSKDVNGNDILLWEPGMVVYENLQGEVSITTINQIDIADVHTKEVSDEQMVGTWEITDTGKPGMLPGEEAQSSFDEATKELLGVTLNPIVLFGTQVVAGTNYKALCRGRTATADPQLNLYVVTWNTDPEGKSSVVSNEVFDIEYYVTPQD